MSTFFQKAGILNLLLPLLFVLSFVSVGHAQDGDEVIYVKPIGSSKEKETVVKTQQGSEAEEENTSVPFTLIEQAPVYPGCESYQSTGELRNCMVSNINALVAANFNARDNSLAKGKYRILVSFTIDAQGYVQDIQAKGPTVLLENEAIRVIKLLPRMTPGTQRGKGVAVAYTLPVVFQLG